MSLIIKGMKLPQHVAVNGEKDTAYKCVILAHPDNSVELVIDIKFASAYDNGEKCVHEWYDVGEYVFADTIRNADTIIEAEVSE